MIATVVFLLWTLCASVSGTCLSPVSCSCGKSNQTNVLCAEKTLSETDPCVLLSNCLTCRDELNECVTCPLGFQGPTCTGKYGRRKAIRRKRQAQIGNCPTIYPPENGHMVCRDARRNGYCRASCNSGFTFEGKEWEPEIILECRTRGYWYPDRAFPPCVGGVVESDCPDPEIPAGATRYPPPRPYPGLFEEKDNLTYGCANPDATLQGESLLTCQIDGTWSAPVPQCVVEQPNEDCLFPGVDPNGQVVVRGRGGSTPPNLDDVFPPRTRLIYTCNRGYTRDGPSAISCRPTGEWSDDYPYCIINDGPEPSNYCPNLGPIHHGTVSLRLSARAKNPDKELPVGTTVEYTCRRGYIMQGSQEITCQEDGTWTGLLPSCVEGCGLRSAEVEALLTWGENTTNGEWPWVVLISKEDDSDFRCGGVLLDRRTVLTAAHCLKNPGPFLLHFGKFFLSNNLDDSQVQVRRSERVRKHPDYNAETYDNDIALIRFSPHIRYDSRILPVCLPTPESTRDNLTPTTKGYVTGWGHTELDRDPTSLMMARLPVQSDAICASSYRDRGLSFDPASMLCAGYPRGGISTCRGDSGSGLVFRDENSEGRFVVEGIVSYNVEGSCGMPNRYTVFTRVSHFMDWIRWNV